MSKRIPRKALFAGLFVLGITTIVLAIDSGMQRMPVAVIEDDMGTPVRASLRPPAVLDTGDEDIQIFKNCKIGNLGNYPWHPVGKAYTASWRAATSAALQYTGMPEEAARKAVHAIEHENIYDMVDMTNLGGTGLRGQTYSAIFDTTYKSQANGRVVCLQSRLNFAKDSQKTSIPVWLIEHNNKTYLVSYFKECNNVTPIEWGVLDQPGVVPTPVVNEVPEPSSILLILIGLVAMVIQRKTK